MDFFEAIILGIVQGLTEFLPISSSGHLVIFQNLMGHTEDSIVFDVAVHLGTVLSIFTVYFYLAKDFFKDLFSFVQTRKANNGTKLFLLLFVASLPTAVIGLSLKDYFEALFLNTKAVGIFLCITGLLLIFTKNKAKDGQMNSRIELDGLVKIPYLKAIVMGFAQGMAIAPGISRSGITIATGIYLGLPRNIVAGFSFIMSLPAIIGAALLQVSEASQAISGQWGVLLVGIISAYISGLVGLLLVLKFVKKGRLDIFSFYLWVVGPLVYFIL